MEETVIMNEAQPVNNENNNENVNSENNESGKEQKSVNWQQVAVGGAAGIALGTIATVSMAATTAYAAESLTPEHTTLEGVNGTAFVDSCIPVAQVSDDMTYGEAFTSAHEQVGPGGVFVWHGQVYGTYTADEWNSMTPEEHAEYGSHVHVTYDEPLASTSQSADSGHTTVEQDDVQTIEVDHTATAQDQHEAQTPQTDTAQTETPNQEVVAPEVEVQVDPEIEVIDYQTLTYDDGSQADMAVVSVDGQEVGVFDVDQDGTADLMAQDVNHDQQITADEIVDISGENISMQSLHDDFLASNELDTPGSDYINDGDIDSYMA